MSHRATGEMNPRILRGDLDGAFRSKKISIEEFKGRYPNVDCKYLSTAEAANREGVLPRSFQKRLMLDARKPADKRRYPGAYRCQCGHGWFVPESELKQRENKS